MNQNLKNLMLMAGYAAPELASRAIRLAELIVRDCVDLCEDVRVADYVHEDWDKGYDKGLEQAAETISEHFGIS